MTTNNIQRSLLSVKAFHEKHNSFPEGGLRHLIFFSKPRPNAQCNGLVESGALVRLGSKILIDEAKFFEWLDSKQDVA